MTSKPLDWKCPKCDGAGIDPETSLTCPLCEGTGAREAEIDRLFGHANERERHLASRVVELDREIFILRQRIADLEALLDLEREPRPRHDDDPPPFPDE